MPNYRKKPVIVQAVQFNGVDPTGTVSWSEAPDWLIAATQQESGTSGAISILRVPSVCAQIFTLEGAMTADVGDWIIRGVKQELYPCKPDIFEATYELAEEQTTPRDVRSISCPLDSVVTA
jgi:hypothetical protein